MNNDNEIYIDITKQKIIQSINLIQGQVNLDNPYKFIISENRTRKDLTEYKVEMALYDTETGKGKVLDISIGNAKDGEILLPISKNLTNVDGIFTCQLHIYKENVEDYTGTFNIAIEKNVFNYIAQEIEETDDWRECIKALKEIPIALSCMPFYNYYQTIIEEKDYKLDSKTGFYVATVIVPNTDHSCSCWLNAYYYDYQLNTTGNGMAIITNNDLDKNGNFIAKCRFEHNHTVKVGFRKVSSGFHILHLESFALATLQEEQKETMSDKDLNDFVKSINTNLSLNGELSYNKGDNNITIIDDKFKMAQLSITYNNNTITEDQLNRIKNYIYPFFKNINEFLHIQIKLKFGDAKHYLNDFYYNLKEDKWINKEDINL